MYDSICDTILCYLNNSKVHNCFDHFTWCIRTDVWITVYILYQDINKRICEPRVALDNRIASVYSNDSWKYVNPYTINRAYTISLYNLQDHSPAIVCKYNFKCCQNGRMKKTPNRQTWLIIIIFHCL